MTATTRERYAAGSAAGSLDSLVSLEPITSLAALHQALANGHPILTGAALPDASPTSAERTSGDSPEGTGGSPDGAGGSPDGAVDVPAASDDSATARFARFATHTRHLDRLRALELLHLATTAGWLALSSPASRTALDGLFPSPDTSESAPEGTFPSPDDTDTPTTAHDPSTDPAQSSADGPALTNDQDSESFCSHAEFVLTTADETAIAASLDSRTGLARKHIGHALTAYIGTPLLLRAILEGRLRFNRWESLIRRFSWLPLTSLRAVDVFITTLDIRMTLHQFMRRVSQFIATLTQKPTLAARASKSRRAWIEDLPGGQSILCAKGPTPLVHAHFNEGEALARALVKNQLKLLDVTTVQKETSENEPTSEDEARTADASVGLPPGEDLSLDDQRMIQQLTFDTLISARPRTETVLEHATGSTDETDTYHVQVSLPDEATVLRKHATVVVTVPATTLLGLDNRPGMIADTPIPADMARTIAASSTVWYRMLTDPSTGRVLDHVAHTYEPDRATRMSVMSKWQTCTAPGCSRPARHCDIDHGIPFNHDHPEQGGRTEPANLHPLCRRHHQAKTEGHLRMRRITADEIEWILPLGATSTTLAPSLDDGGVLTRLSAGQNTRATAAPESAPSTHDVLTPDEAMARVWKQYLEEEKRWDEQVTQVTECQRTALADERARFQAWVDSQKALLEQQEEGMSTKHLALLRARDRHEREWRLLAVHRAAIHEHNQACGAALPPRVPLSWSDPVSSTIKWKSSIVPMHVDEFAPRNQPAFSLHVPLEPMPFTLTIPAQRSASEEARVQARWDDRLRACTAHLKHATTSHDQSGEQDQSGMHDQSGENASCDGLGEVTAPGESAHAPQTTPDGPLPGTRGKGARDNNTPGHAAPTADAWNIGARLIPSYVWSSVRPEDVTNDPPPF